MTVSVYEKIITFLLSYAVVRRTSRSTSEKTFRARLTSSFL